MELLFWMLLLSVGAFIIGVLLVHARRRNEYRSIRVSRILLEKIDQVTKEQRACFRVTNRHGVCISRIDDGEHAFAIEWSLVGDGKFLRIHGSITPCHPNMPITIGDDVFSNAQFNFAFGVRERDRGEQHSSAMFVAYTLTRNDAIVENCPTRDWTGDTLNTREHRRLFDSIIKQFQPASLK